MYVCKIPQWGTSGISLAQSQYSTFLPQHFTGNTVNNNVSTVALVISNSEGLSELHRDTRSSTYQISKIEKKNLTTKCPKFICNLTPLHKIYIY